MSNRKKLLKTVWSDRKWWELYLKWLLPEYESLKIEKDYFLTIILHHIAKKLPDLVFKWWTCLNKCYFKYFRLSEDLDFTIITDGGRATRSKLLGELFDVVAEYLVGLWMKLRDERKRDACRFGWMVWEYESLIDWTIQTIQFDVKTMKQYERPVVQRPIFAIFTDPLTSEPIFTEQMITTIALDEAMAEKMRAALTRNTPAIRDYYDIAFARREGFDFENIRDLIALKIAEVWWIDVERDAMAMYTLLEKQIITDLEPVIGESDRFDFDAVRTYTKTFKQ